MQSEDSSKPTPLRVTHRQSPRVERTLTLAPSETELKGNVGTSLDIDRPYRPALSAPRSKASGAVSMLQIY